MNPLNFLKIAAHSIFRGLLWVARNLGAVFFILGTLGIIAGIILLVFVKDVSPVFATLLIVASLILWGVDAYFTSRTGFMPFALLIIVWEISYIGLYYIFEGIFEPEKIIWLYVGLISLIIFTQVSDTNIRTAAAISLYLYSISILGAIIFLQSNGKTIGAGLLGTGINIMVDMIKELVSDLEYVQEVVEPVLNAVQNSHSLEYYVYAFVALYWLAREKQVENIVVGERLPRILAAYTLVFAGLFIVGLGIFSTLHSTSPDDTIRQILSTAMGFLVLLYGVSIIRAYKNLIRS